MAEERLESEVIEILSQIKQGNNFVLSGGAGSGKTYSLIQLIDHLLKVNPKARIACLTYTNAAVKEINSRFQNNNLFVSTIHEFLWGEIVGFQKAIKQTLLEIVNDPESKIINPNSNEPFNSLFEDGIKYKEYLRIKDGIISHDEVLLLANHMYKKYSKLRKILCDKYDFIFLDEYQDTSKLVVEILLDFLTETSGKSIIGFFGDQMQSIYEDGVGDINNYILKNQIREVKKKQNRRNPLSVINLANMLRTDDIIQEPSKDENAPNMYEGEIIQGDVKFIYSKSFQESDINKIKENVLTAEWDFGDSFRTKELRLTHNLIADKAGYPTLMQIYDKDPIIDFKKEINKAVKERSIPYSADTTFEEIINVVDLRYSPTGKYKGATKLSVRQEAPEFNSLFAMVKNKTYESLRSIYFDKDNLIDDKKDDLVDEAKRNSKRDYLIKQLFKIQELIDLYNNQNYHEFIHKTGFKVTSISSKKRLKEKMEKLEAMRTQSISQIIDFADKESICLKDDRYERFIEKNWYLFERVGVVPYEEFEKLYRYLEGYVPLSTQHKIKGTEFENVLVILEKGGWNNYNFEYLLYPGIKQTLPSSKKSSFDSILKRTQKLFYVCCTRAKRNLIIYYPEVSEEIIKNVEKLIEKKNVINIEELEDTYEN